MSRFRVLVLSVLLLVAACTLVLDPGDNSFPPGDADADTDADGDIDGDADADGDGDVDGDVDGDTDADGDDGGSDADADECVGRCDDDIDCTTDRCEDGVCEHAIEPGYCLIDDVCWDNGTINPENLCEYCDADGDLNATWSVRVGFSCNDGLSCTDTDQCRVDGTCRGRDTCEADEYDCTLDYCSSAGCQHPIDDHTCLIDGVCYADGEGRSDTPCKVCNDMLGPSDDWYMLPDGVPCGVDGTCEGGECVDPE